MNKRIPLSPRRAQCLLAFAACVSLPAAARAGYSVANTFVLSPSPGYTHSASNAIAGMQQGGRAYNTAAAGYHAILWKGPGSNFVDLQPAAGYGWTDVLGISTTQQAGYGLVGSDSHALIWNGTAASFVDLQPAGYSQSSAYSTTGTQQAGFGNSIADGDAAHALRWSGTAASAVDLHPGGMFIKSYAYYNDGNQQVGQGIISESPVGAVAHALMWSGSAGSVVDLNPAGLLGSVAMSIEGTQQGGYTFNTEPQIDQHAAIWNGSAASYVNLHPAAGWDITRVESTNGFQQAGFGIAAGGGSNHALLWSGTAASIVDLTPLVPGGASVGYGYGIDAYGNVTGEATIASNFRGVVWYAGDVFVGAGSNWYTASNWTVGVPVAGDDVEVIPYDSTSRTINYIGGPALGKLTLDSTGSGQLTLSQTAGTLQTTADYVGVVGHAIFSQSGGTHIVGSLNVARSAGSNGTCNLTLGVFTVNTNAYVGGASTGPGGNGSINVSGGVATVLGDMRVFPGGSVNWSGGTITVLGTLDLAGGKFIETNHGARLLKVGTVVSSSGGFLDLADNDMQATADTYANITTQIRLARNGGAWNLGGITSTAARNALPKITTLGTLTGQQYKAVQGATATFDGSPVANSDVLVKYTWYGDTDFTGKVDGADYARIDTTYNNELTQGNIGGWINGDLDYNGRVDGADYALIDAAFNGQSGLLRPPGSVVPEPAATAVVLFTTVCGRRRRRSA